VIRACLVRGVSGLGLNPQGGSPRHRVLVPVGHLGPRQLPDRSVGRSRARPAAWSRAPSSGFTESRFSLARVRDRPDVARLGKGHGAAGRLRR